MSRGHWGQTPVSHDSGNGGLTPISGDARGQTTTEYVMISGLMLVVATGLLAVMNPTVRDILRRITECVISDVCNGGSSFFPW
jgi:hypothetical protein